jgi:hypothetical protein
MKYVFFIIVFCTLNFTNGQSCKVKIQAISSSYHGDCKSGLAHGQGEATGTDRYSGSFKKGYPEGQGTYTWQNGDVYEGEWKKGKMDGKGKLTTNNGSVQTGYWEKDKYLGKYKEPFKKLDKSSNVSSFSLVQDKGISNNIRFYLKEDQKMVQNPSANIVVHHGNYTNVINTNSYVELQNVSFPFKAKVYFDSNYIEFEIFNPGMWQVNTNVTNIKGLNSN